MPALSLIHIFLKNYDGAGSYTVFRSDKSSNGVRFYTNSNGCLLYTSRCV